YDKMELPNYGVFDEKRYFREGARTCLFELEGAFFAITICEDIWIEGAVPETFARSAKVDFVLNISASPFHAGKLDTRFQIARRFAANTGASVCFNNLVGGQDELVFDGGSFVLSPGGQVISRATRFKEELLVTDIWPGTEGVLQERVPGSGARRDIIALAQRDHPPAGTLEPSLAEVITGAEEVYSALVLGTRDYVRKNGFSKAVLGLSGGIDSSLTAVVAVDALGEENVTGVTMPSRYTSGETLSDAAVLAANLGVRLITIPIEGMYRAYLEALEGVLGDGRHGVAHENIQARIRGNILMALSNHFGWLVLTTGNKSEVAVGYCTLYGDMAGGFAVIKDVPKTLVYTLAGYVNASKQREVIPRSVLERAPSAELRPEQKDEDSLPPYEVLDNVLSAYVEEDRSPGEIIRAGFDPAVVTRVVSMVDLNEYKRRQAPPGVKITPKAFGKDRRLPITNRYLKNLFH
ncbi:NAD+ synthase, partial [Thermodesulfobacteriota bacterium]